MRCSFVRYSLRRHRQEDFELAALADRAAGGNLPAVALDNLTAQGKPNACALENIARVPSLEHPKDALAVLFLETNAIVFDHDAALLIRRMAGATILPSGQELARHFDNRRLFDAMKLQPIGDQILQ